MPARRWPLGELRARWIPVANPRHNVGFSFDCPLHPATRLTVRFANPYDGGKPIRGPGLLVWMVSNGGLGRVTVETPARLETLDFGDCGKFRILIGHVFEVP